MNSIKTLLIETFAHLREEAKAAGTGWMERRGGGEWVSKG